MKVREFIEKFVKSNTFIKLYRLDDHMDMYEIMDACKPTEIYDYPELYSLEVHSVFPSYEESSKNILYLIVDTKYTTYEIEKIKYKLHGKYTYYFKDGQYFGYIHILQNALDCDMKDALIVINKDKSLVGNYIICRDIQNSSIVLHKFYSTITNMFEYIRDSYVNDYVIDDRYEIIGYFSKS